MRGFEPPAPASGTRNHTHFVTGTYAITRFRTITYRITRSRLNTLNFVRSVTKLCQTFRGQRVVFPVIAPVWIEVDLRRRWLFSRKEALSAERDECLLNDLEKWWNLGLDYIPDDVFIKPKIPMG